MIKHICFIAHGIRTGRRNWIPELIAYLKTQSSKPEEWLFVDGSYKFMPAFLLAFPLTQAVARFANIRLKQRKLWQLQREYHDAEINIIAHSWGTMLCYDAIRHSDNDTGHPAIKIDKFIMWGGIVSEQEKFMDTIGHGKIKRIFNYHSENDDVVRFQPIYGKSGYSGFRYAPAEVANIETEARHNDYNKPGVFWDLAAAHLGIV